MSVMCQMDTFQKEIAISNDGAIRGVRSPVDDNFFTDGIVVTDSQDRVITLEFEILWSGTDNGSMINRVVFTHAGAA